MSESCCSNYQLHNYLQPDKANSWCNVEKPSRNGEDDFSNFTEDEDVEPYISERVQKQMNTDTSLTPADREIIQYLAMRKFHIPGNSFFEDYRYWFSNNHPFLCFWLADKRHPLGTGERLINLMASLAFGLAATCCVVLWFFYEENRDFDTVAFTIPLIHYDICVGMLVLLAFSGPLHVVFDLSIYFIQACPPCRENGLFEKYKFPTAHQQCWLWLGTHIAFLVTVGSMALAVNVVLIRASIIDDGDGDDITYKVKNYDFMLLYMLEVIVANFVVFPIGTLTVFSGVLGCCGRIPGLGGRPYQVRKHQRLMQSRRASF